MRRAKLQLFTSSFLVMVRAKNIKIDECFIELFKKITLAEFFWTLLILFDR